MGSGYKLIRSSDQLAPTTPSTSTFEERSYKSNLEGQNGARIDATSNLYRPRLDFIFLVVYFELLFPRHRLT